MIQLRTCACVLGALLLTGRTAAGAAEHVTGHTASGPARPTGHVTGRLLIEGGPIAAAPHERGIPKGGPGDGSPREEAVVPPG